MQLPVEAHRWAEAKDGGRGDGGGGEGGRGDGGREDGAGEGGERGRPCQGRGGGAAGEGGEGRRPCQGSQRQSRNQVSPQDEFERGLSSKRDSLVKNPDESLLSTSRRGSHRQSRNQVSPQEEEEVECLNSKVGSGRQSRMLSPELEYVKRAPPWEREWTGRGEEVVSFERETVSKPKRRSGEGGGLCENREEIEKTMNGYCEEQEVTRLLLLPKSPQRITKEIEKPRSMNKDQEVEEVVRRCNENDPSPPPPPPLQPLLMLKSPQRPPDPSLLVLPTEVT